MKSTLFTITAACAAIALTSCSKPAEEAKPAAPAAAKPAAAAPAAPAAAEAAPAAPAAPAAAAPAAGETMALKTELPNELVVGTPKDLSAVANLDNNKKPEPIMVPKDAALLSKGKPVTSSDKEEPFEGELGYVTDGSKDGNEGYSVIIGEGPQWVQIDLESPSLVDGIVLWHYFKNDRVTNDVIVQVSDDAEFKTGVTTLFNSDLDNSCGQGAGTDKAYIGTFQGKQIAGQGAKGRYVRCWSNGNTDNPMNEYIEVEVWGRAAK